MFEKLTQTPHLLAFMYHCKLHYNLDMKYFKCTSQYNHLHLISNHLNSSFFGADLWSYKRSADCIQLKHVRIRIFQTLYSHVIFARYVKMLYSHVKCEHDEDFHIDQNACSTLDLYILFSCVQCTYFLCHICCITSKFLLQQIWIVEFTRHHFQIMFIFSAS